MTLKKSKGVRNHLSDKWILSGKISTRYVKDTSTSTTAWRSPRSGRIVEEMTAAQATEEKIMYIAIH
jgi:hypothetical protein